MEKEKFKPVLPPPPAPPAKEKKPKEFPFSIIFAIGLTITALIFFNRIYNDIGNAIIEDVTKLVWKTLFVLPLIVIAFVLFFTLYKQGSRYRTVLVPYFITAILLLLRLLVEIGRFFYAKYYREAFYVSTVLVMTTLTGLIFYIQSKSEKD